MGESGRPGELLILIGTAAIEVALANHCGGGLVEVIRVPLFDWREDEQAVIVRIGDTDLVAHDEERAWGLIELKLADCGRRRGAVIDTQHPGCRLAGHEAGTSGVPD